MYYQNSFRLSYKVKGEISIACRLWLEKNIHRPNWYFSNRRLMSIFLDRHLHTFVDYFNFDVEINSNVEFYLIGYDEFLSKM